MLENTCDKLYLKKRNLEKLLLFFSEYFSMGKKSMQLGIKTNNVIAFFPLINLLIKDIASSLIEKKGVV